MKGNGTEPTKGGSPTEDEDAPRGAVASALRSNLNNLNFSFMRSLLQGSKIKTRHKGDVGVMVVCCLLFSVICCVCVCVCVCVYVNVNVNIMYSL